MGGKGERDKNLALFNFCVLAFCVFALGFYSSIFDFLNLAELCIFDNVPN